jgi:hypothetical protein
LAFRCSTKDAPAPQFHAAVEKILSLRNLYESTGLFIAECDIKGFFDCVEHEVAWQSLEQLIADAKGLTPGLQIDARALRIFRAYLECYAFNRDVLGEAEKHLRDRLGNRRAHYRWPRADLQSFHGLLEGKRIGVPQGGALSCIIANSVLHSADKSLRALERQGPGHFTYLRYCDDMVILSPVKSSCERAFGEYHKCLERLKLPVHPPTEVAPYRGPAKRQFWQGKSNKPYHWGQDTAGGDLPWIQFVGYQIRYDGLLRIRRKSLKRHLRKLTSAADDLLRQLTPSKPRPGERPVFSTRLRKSPRQILHRFRQKLLSMSVGRRTLRDKMESPLPMTWVAGYRGLHGRKFVSGMLALLDRHRERQIRRVQRRLTHMPEANGATQTLKLKLPRFFGHPFSYSGQLKNGLRQ